MRARRGDHKMTMRALAERARVSERFLVQLEAGEGNISVARLEDVAEALETTGADLLSTASRAMRVTPPPRRTIALVGLRGAGKSTIGTRLAERLGMAFVELDDLVVQEAQMTLSTLFEIHGESHYRRLEREVLERLLAKNERVVVATGGSIVTDPATFRLLQNGARTIWLKAKPEEHFQRVVAQGDARPMQGRPRAMKELRALLDSRESLYAQADVVVDTSGRLIHAVVDAATKAMTTDVAPIGNSGRR